MLMEKRLIARGLFAGAVGAVLAFVFARLFAEPVIARAIEFEDGRSEAAHARGVHEHGAELLSRGVQGNAGLGFGVLIFGMAVGAVFAVLFCVSYARLGDVEPQLLSIRLAAASFTVIYAVPFLKYPPNPPAVGQADTIGSRTMWYLSLVLASVLLAICAVWLSRRLAERLSILGASLLAVGAYMAAVTAVMLVLPSAAETPEPMRDVSGAIVYPGFPADVLYEFRLVSLGTYLVLWVGMGLVFSALADRVLARR